MKKLIIFLLLIYTTLTGTALFLNSISGNYSTILGFPCELGCVHTDYKGRPFSYEIKECTFYGELDCFEDAKTTFYTHYFILDIVIWLAVGALISTIPTAITISVIEKLKARKAIGENMIVQEGSILT